MMFDRFEPMKARFLPSPDDPASEFRNPGIAARPCKTICGVIELKLKNDWICEVSTLSVLGSVIFDQLAESVPALEESEASVVLSGSDRLADPVTAADSRLVMLVVVSSSLVMMPVRLDVFGSVRFTVTPALLKDAVPLVM